MRGASRNVGRSLGRLARTCDLLPSLALAPDGLGSQMHRKQGERARGREEALGNGTGRLQLFCNKQQDPHAGDCMGKISAMKTRR